MNRKLTHLLVNIILSILAIVIYVVLHIIGHDFYIEFYTPTTWGLSLRFVIYDAVYVIFPSFFIFTFIKSRYSWGVGGAVLFYLYITGFSEYPLRITLMMICSCASYLFLGFAGCFLNRKLKAQ